MASDARYRFYWLSARAKSFRGENDFQIVRRVTDLDVQIVQEIPKHLVVVPFLYLLKRRRGMKRNPSSKRHSPNRRVAVFSLWRARFDKAPLPWEAMSEREV
jgi:hypothetical protein